MIIRNWFKKKKIEAPPEAPKKVTYTLESWEALRIKKLQDALIRQTVLGVKGNAEKYLLWEAVGEILPETKVGTWTLKNPTALTVSITKDGD